ncbi:molybdenum ABC transporter ATP-binding protein [Rhodobacterales bacterium HKCCE3408]|nr:molybdenum ABC transporter ATP-binding protein [Rhodobacterales bacterium HKCCE3408]
MSALVSLRHRLGAVELSIEAEMPPGITVLFGPSGAGKTSILRAIAGLLHPEDGRITAGGETWLDTGAGIDLPAHRRRVGYVFQEPRLFPHLTVARNIAYGGQPDAALIELLGLGPLLSRRPGSLSGGEAQRVALARALSRDPSILLMDEPLSALDLGLKRDILPFFERLRDEAGRPILYVSHDIDEVARLADRVILIEDGRAGPSRTVAEALTGDPGSALGRAIAGGLLVATVAAHDPEDNLTEARIGDQRLWLPGRIGEPGDRLRLRLDARDVTLALDRPQGISALNILPATVTAIDPGPGAGALVRLDHQGQGLTARLTRRSVTALGLEPGRRVFAILKTMAATPERVAGG